MMLRIGNKDVDFILSDDGSILTKNWATDQYEACEDLINWARDIIYEVHPYLPVLSITNIVVDLSGNVWAHTEDIEQNDLDSPD